MTGVITMPPEMLQTQPVAQQPKTNGDTLYVDDTQQDDLLTTTDEDKEGELGAQSSRKEPEKMISSVIVVDGIPPVPPLPPVPPRVFYYSLPALRKLKTRMITSSREQQARRNQGHTQRVRQRQWRLRTVLASGP